MNGLKLLDDQPATTARDHLHFERYLNAIQATVLKRKETAPFVVGIYGKWGTGKSSLMMMLAERLRQEPDNWEIVEFSPWIYRNEKSLLLPLLATLAKRRPPFEKLVKNIVEWGPGLIEMLSKMGLETATSGLPLLSLLGSIRQKEEEQEQAKDLAEKIKEAVKEVTGASKRMVFLIDDLDRCHDPEQIIGLLEQIQLFLHLDRCIFFLCADKDQIIKAIEKRFPGEGGNYLDKFVQLPLELHPHHSHHLTELLGLEDAAQRRYLMRVVEVLNRNPRKLKKLWNQALVGLEVVKEELARVQPFPHEASLELMLKWLLLAECEVLRSDPYLYLRMEALDEEPAAASAAAHQDEQFSLDQLYQRLGLRRDNGEWLSSFCRRLAMFLWQDLELHRFKSPAVLSLYARASGEDIGRSRQFIEEACFGGQKELHYQYFSQADLRDGQFCGMRFHRCDFSYADLQGANLNDTIFERCDLNGVCFDQASIERVRWIACDKMDQLATEPGLYESIADRAVQVWRESESSARADWNQESLFKAYKTVLDLHKEQGSLSEEVEKRLREKGIKIRQDISSQ